MVEKRENERNIFFVYSFSSNSLWFCPIPHDIRNESCITLIKQIICGRFIALCVCSIVWFLVVQHYLMVNTYMCCSFFEWWMLNCYTYRHPFPFGSQVSGCLSASELVRQSRQLRHLIICQNCFGAHLRICSGSHRGSSVVVVLELTLF